MFFGLNTFGGVFAGLVLVSGAADSTAEVQVTNQVTRLFAGTASSLASASGFGLRVANNYPVTLLATAMASIAPAQVEFHPLPVTIVGTATAAPAYVRADYQVYSLLSAAQATGYGASRRLVKVYPLRAECLAGGEAEAQIWQMGYANPAIGTAEGFGTTYHLTYGQATGTASLTDSPRHQKGGFGEAIATCEVSGYGRFQIGAAGLGECPAIGNGDPAVTVSGIRYFEVNADGQALAEAYAGTVGITQAQTGRCYATATGYGWYIIGGHGHATAYAEGLGIGDVMGTGATAEPGESNASVTGWASVQLHGTGVPATAFATGSADALKTVTKVYANPAAASAQLNSPAGFKLLYAASLANATALLQVAHVDRAVHLNPGLAFASASLPRSEWQLRPTPAYAEAMVVAEGVRVVVAEGNGFGLATAIGFNEINDLVHAPGERTVTVEAFERLVVLVQDSRLVLV